jgi:hypothetical protein
LDDPSQEPKAGDDAATAAWYDLQEVWNSRDMAFDHKEILK